MQAMLGLYRRSDGCVGSSVERYVEESLLLLLFYAFCARGWVQIRGGVGREGGSDLVDWVVISHHERKKKDQSFFSFSKLGCLFSNLVVILVPHITSSFFLFLFSFFFLFLFTKPQTNSDSFTFSGSTPVVEGFIAGSPIHPPST